MLLPALSQAKTKAQGILCMSNNHQLMLAWQMYNVDNNDRIVMSFTGATPREVRLPTTRPKRLGWWGGWTGPLRWTTRTSSS